MGGKVASVDKGAPGTGGLTLGSPSSRTLSDLLAEQAMQWPAHPAVVHAKGTTTYADLHARSLLVRDGLTALGVGRRDRVGLLATNRIEWLECCFGAVATGATVHAINTWVARRELEHILEEADCTVLVLMASCGRRRFAEDLQQIIPENGSGARWRSPRFPSLREVIVIDGGTPPGALDYEDWLGDAATGEPPEQREGVISAGTAAVVLYTSGSTARPKAVPLLHYGMVENGYHIGERLGLTHDDRVWLSSPLFWSFGCANALMATFTHAATLVLQELFDASEAVTLIERESCSAAYLLPTLIYAIHDEETFDRRRISSLRTGLTIGSPDDMRLAVESLGIEAICNVYGATETYGNCCVTPHDMALEDRMTCQGPPLPGVTLRIVKPGNGSVLPVGEVGEIEVTGYLTPGYLGDTTRSAFTADGYYRTGDMGFLDERGWIHYKARATDIIKTAGINVAPAEVEEYLIAVDGVEQVAVVGAPDRARGEIVVAFVVPSVGVTLDAADLINHCRAGLASYKVPAQIVVIAELPKTETGKLSRRVLRERAQAETSAVAQDVAGGHQGRAGTA